MITFNDDGSFTVAHPDGSVKLNTTNYDAALQAFDPTLRPMVDAYRNEFTEELALRGEFVNTQA